MPKSSRVIDWRWAINSTDRLPWQAKFVALSLSCSMDATGYCDRVSGDLLADRTGIARSTVFEGLRALRRRGWLRVGKVRIRRGAGGYINTYTATFPSWHRLHDETGGQHGVQLERGF
jgi:hypothetical protein